MHRPFRLTVVCALVLAAVACGGEGGPSNQPDGGSGPGGDGANGGWTTVRLGVLGDSNSDEYRADDDRGGAYEAVTFNWVEIFQQTGRIDVGPWGTWGGPRRSGFERNWARSGATAGSLISGGQHTGLAAQIANGELTHVVIYIGTNDLKTTNDTYEEIYDGSLSGAALQAKIDGIVEDITTAVDTLLAAGNVATNAATNVEILVVGFADPGILPETIASYPDAAFRQRVTDTVDAINAGIESMVADRQILYFDQAKMAEEWVSRLDANGYLDVGGELIDAFRRGDEPHFMVLDDHHLGTVGNGLLGNLVFEVFRQDGTVDIPPLTDDEILQIAGIR